MATKESEMIDAFLVALEQMQRSLGLVVVKSLLIAIHSKATSTT